MMRLTYILTCCISFAINGLAQQAFQRIRSETPITSATYDSLKPFFQKPNPDDSTLYYHCVLHLKRNAYKEAKRLYITLNQKNPQFLWLPFLNGILHYRSDDYAGSVSWFSKQIQIDSMHYRARFNRALAYIKSEEVLYAIEDLNLCILQEPYNYRAFALLAYLYQFTGNYPLALQHYEILLGLNPYYTEAYTGMAFIHTENNQPEKACTVIANARQKGITIDPHTLHLFCPN